MKVKLLKDVGDKKSGEIVDTNEKMVAHLISYGLAEKAIESAPENKMVGKAPKNK